jgi:GT2 family glycosyltransferase
LITLVLTYRNRDLQIAENCLNSLAQQSEKDFKVILVDYGSDSIFAEGIEKSVVKYEFIKLISCPTREQLWSKCRSINIALRQTNTPYFLVGDIDLIFHPDFIKIATEKASEQVLYFQYGFLSENESLQKKDFEAYEVDFFGTKDVTGTTLFPTDKLQEVNGYDEFYHGWGAEDTDIHIRLKNSGVKVEFYNESVLVKHQWHPKVYRSKSSTKPFHSNLERVNQRYMQLTESTKRTRVNLDNESGKLPLNEAYNRLKERPDQHLKLESSNLEVCSLFAQLKNYKGEIVSITVADANRKKKTTQNIKKLLKKKHATFLPMETVNNLLLEEIIKNYRNVPYSYNFDRQKKVINLTLIFSV